MNTFRITHYNRERPILAIKAVRALSGMGLKESKAVIDRMSDGAGYGEFQSTVNEWAARIVMADCGLEAHIVSSDGVTPKVPHSPKPPEDVVAAFLARLDPTLTVGQVCDVLRAAHTAIHLEE